MPSPQARYDVVAIGSAIVDVLTSTNDDFIAAEGMTKGTMALVDGTRAKDLYDRMGPAVEVSGGSAANTMAGIASLGGKPAFIGKVGEDQLGKIFSHEFKAAGVDFHGSAARTTLATAMCFILVTPDAQRTMNTYLGACTELSPDDIDAKLIAQSDVLYIEGYQWDTARAKEAIRKATTAAKSAARKVSLSLSDPFVVERHRADLETLIRDDIDILFGNEEEIFRLTGTTNIEAAVGALRLSRVLAAVTRGAKGAIVIDAGTVTEVPAAPVAQVIDTTGAGDLFAAGFLYGYTHGRDLGACARLGALAAGEIISHMGARPEADLRALMAKAGL
jgi:sugar/nucleoside kinase (ribokinase family)